MTQTNSADPTLMSLFPSATAGLPSAAVVMRDRMTARAAIREVAAWLREHHSECQMGGDAAAQECTDAFLRAVLARAAAHGLAIGENAIRP